jgi:acetylornithine aminotransferase
MKTFDVYPLYPIHITYGKGSYVYDENDQPFLDFYGGHAVISVGHGHPHYIQRLKDQLDQIGFYSNSVQNKMQDHLAEKLGQVSNYEDYQLFLINSGAEANENALKLASFHTGKSKIIAFKKGFHGRTAAAVNITDNPAIIAPINKGFPCTLLDFCDTEALRSELKKGDVAAIIIEGIQGIAGIYQPSSEFLLEIQDLAKKYECVFILDEIQSGYGRTGRFFAHQAIPDLRPDLITVAKGMANGFPMGGVLISNYFTPKYGLLGTTFGGNHLGCAAALAVLEIIVEENLIENAKNIGNYLLAKLGHLEGVVEVRGSGLMIGIELPFNTKELRSKLLFEHHLFVGSSSDPNTIRLLPPLNINQTEADLCIERFKMAIGILDRSTV